MSRVSTVEMQFGTATLDSSGVGPILVTVSGSDANIAFTLLPNENVNMSAYTVLNPLYAIASSEQNAVDYNYLIVSST
jgi:hypothetical protein